MSSELMILRLLLHLPGANELMQKVFDVATTND